MTQAEIEIVIEKYNSLRESANYWIDGGMRLVEHLHASGMKYRDIYAIMEKETKRSAA